MEEVYCFCIYEIALRNSICRYHLLGEVGADLKLGQYVHYILHIQLCGTVVAYTAIGTAMLMFIMYILEYDLVRGFTVIDHRQS